MRRTPIIHTLRSDGTYTTAAALASDTGATPTFARNCTAYRDYWDGATRKLVEVAANVPRWCKRKDSGDTSRFGLLIEPQRKNFIPNSGDMTQWYTHSNTVSAVTGGPFGTYYSICDNDTSSKNRYFDNYIGLTNDKLQAGTTYVQSIFIKKGAWDWVLFVHLDGTNNAYQTFNIANGSMGTTTSGQIGAKGIEALGGGWFRIWFNHTRIATDRGVIQIYPVQTDSTNGFYTGVTGEAKFHICAAQCEAGSYPSSYYPSTETLGTRIAEVASYNITGRINQKGSLLFDVMFPNQDLASDVVLATLHDGTANNRIIVSALASGDKLSTQVISGGVEQANITDSTTDICDGNKHTIAVNFAPNFVRQCVDGVAEGTADTSATIPSGITTLTLGDNDGANQPNALISDLKLYNRPGVTS